MSDNRTKWYIWLGPVLGSTAWLFRVVHGWWQIGEHDLMWLTLAVYAVLVFSPVFFHYGQRWANAQKILTMYIGFQGIIVSGLFWYFAMASKVHLFTSSMTFILWLLPCIYVLFATGLHYYMNWLRNRVEIHE